MFERGPLDEILRPYYRYETGQIVIPDEAMGAVFFKLMKLMNKGGAMPAVDEAVEFGPLVRIPVGYGGLVGDRAYRDVTVTEAKREAKRLRKLARQIDKATS